MESHESAPPVFKPDPSRIWVLCAFSFLSAIQCLTWFTYSAVPQNMIAYFPSVSNRFIDFTLILGTIGYLVSISFFQWWNTRPGGMRQTVIAGAWLTFLGNVIRLVPMWVPSLRDGAAALWFISAGQSLNACTGSVILGLVSELSICWFPVNERSTATGIAFTANGMGTLIGFLALPALADTPAHVPRAMYFNLGLAAMALVGVLAHFPVGPRTPPSVLVVGGEQAASSVSAAAQMRALATNFAFMSYFVAGGLFMGAFSSWAGILTQILAQIGWSNAQAGYLGFAQGACSLVTGVFVVGPLIDRVFTRSLRALAILVNAGLVVGFAVVTLLLPLPPVGGARAYDGAHTLLPHHRVAVWSALVFCGAVYGLMGPLYFEIVAEVTHGQATQALTGSLLMATFNATTMLFLGIVAALRIEYMNSLMLAAAVVSLVAAVVAPVPYRRQTAEAASLKAAQGSVNNERTPLLV
eukprot:Amastigsp_a1409_72.p1 type:complete len:468 gc:universal Amastigsp_a1409_72:58-1461(+)